MKIVIIILAVLLIFAVGALIWLSIDPADNDAPPENTTAPQVTTTQPTESEPVQPLQQPDVQTPKVWLANCDEYIGLRTRPDGESVQRILKGESMKLLGWEGRYAHVEYQGQRGYVMSSYIIPEDGLSPLGLRTVPLTDTYTYEQMLTDIHTLTLTYPQTAASEVIGTSLQGRQIPVLRIGNVQAQYHVLLQGSIHGREHMNSWLLMSMADYWLSRESDALKDVCFHIIPMVNPDGVAISQSARLDMEQQLIYLRNSELGLTSDSQWFYALNWKANATGTDLNRNFPADWESLTQITEPSAAGYRGEYPFSAPETATLRYYTLRYDFDVTVSYHSSGSLIYWEYGNKQPVNDLSYSLAKAVEAVSGYTPTSNYDNSRAGYKDWVMDSLGIPSVTIEIGCGDSPLAERELYSIFYRNYRVLPAISGWLEGE